MENLRVYVSCALTHASPEYKNDVFAFKDKLRHIPWVTLLDFVTTNSIQENPDQCHIYCNDIYECVGTAHVLISEVSIPSTGLGWEMGTAHEKHGTPILMCACESAKITNLVIGATIKHEHLNIKQYKKSMLELFDHFVSELQTMHTKMQLKKAL